MPPAVFRRLGAKRDNVYPDALVVMPDGSLIVEAAAGGTLMFPTDKPAFPGVAVRSVKRSGGGLRATVESTHAGTLQFRVLRHARTVISRTMAVGIGKTAISLPRLRRARYRIRANVHGPSNHARLSMTLDVGRHSVRVHL